MEKLKSERKDMEGENEHMNERRKERIKVTKDRKEQRNETGQEGLIKVGKRQDGKKRRELNRRLRKGEKEARKEGMKVTKG